MTTDDQRLIEDYIPLEAISKEARREKLIVYTSNKKRTAGLIRS